jgi:NAD(P)H-dependent FMN reductase
MKRIFALSGSTREHSTNGNLLRAIAALYAQELHIDIYGQLAQLPHFDPDLSGETLPPLVTAYLHRISQADGVIICTPEYVFSPPAVLKNAMEWAVGETVFSNKPTALIVASGVGDKTLESMSLILKTLVQKPLPASSQLLIKRARGRITPTGEILDPGLLAQVKSVVSSLLQEINAPKLPQRF